MGTLRRFLNFGGGAFCMKLGGFRFFGRGLTYNRAEYGPVIFCTF